MTDNLKLNAEIRQDVGKGASRRLRHNDKVPAIIYGAGKLPQPITLEHSKVIKALENEEFYSQLLTLNVAGSEEKVVLKDLQRHVYKPKILHMDFLRVKADEELTMLIPLHFVGEEAAPGIKAGGTVSHNISEVEIRCLPANLPKYIEVDMSKLGLNEALHMSELKLPKGAVLTVATNAEHDQPVVSIHVAKIKAAAEPTEEAEEAPGLAKAEVENNKE